MNPQARAGMAVRLLALYFIVWGASQLGQVASSVHFWFSQASLQVQPLGPWEIFLTAGSAAAPVFWTIGGLVLWKRGDRIGSRLATSPFASPTTSSALDSSETLARVETATGANPVAHSATVEWERVGVVLIGLYAIVESLPRLASAASSWYFSDEFVRDYGAAFGDLFASEVITGGLYLLTGVAFLVGRQRIGGWVRRLAQALWSGQPLSAPDAAAIDETGSAKSLEQ